MMSPSILSKRSMLLILIVVLALIIQITYVLRTEERNQFRNQLLDEIENQVLQYKNGESATIDLSIVSSIAWDRLYIFGPYVPLEVMQQRLKSSWRPDHPSQMEADRDFTILVFTLHGKVVEYVEYRRDLGDFSEAGEKIEGYRINEAIFVMNDRGYVIWLNK